MCIPAIPQEDLLLGETRMNKFLIACAVALLAAVSSPAFAQVIIGQITGPIHVVTMKVTDHVKRTITYERNELNLQTSEIRTVDATTGNWLSTSVESQDGLSSSVTTPEGVATFRTAYPIRKLQPGQQTSGTMQMQFDGQTITTFLSVRMSYENGMCVTRVEGAGNGYHYLARSGSHCLHLLPEWETATIHISGRKTTDLFAVRVN